MPAVNGIKAEFFLSIDAFDSYDPDTKDIDEVELKKLVAEGLKEAITETVKPANDSIK